MSLHGSLLYLSFGRRSDFHIYHCCADDKVHKEAELFGYIIPLSPRCPCRKRSAGWLRRMIVRAAPTCTLWRFSINEDCMYFVLWPKWKISGLEYIQLGLSPVRVPDRGPYERWLIPGSDKPVPAAVPYHEAVGAPLVILGICDETWKAWNGDE